MKWSMNIMNPWLLLLPHPLLPLALLPLEPTVNLDAALHHPAVGTSLFGRNSKADI